MGKAKILENLGEGKYRVQLDTGIEDIKNTSDKKKEEFAKVRDAQEQKQIAYLEAKTAAQIKADELTVALETYKAALTNENRTIVENLTAEWTTAKAAMVNARQEFQIAILKTLTLQKEVETWDYLAQEVEQDSRIVWCVDHYPDLEVGSTVETIENNGEVTRKPAQEEVSSEVKISPGGKKGKGILRRNELLNEKEFYLSQTLKRGWQKHMPTYRTATITEINYTTDKCSITLDEAFAEDEDGPDKNSEDKKGFNLNKKTEFKDVEVDYMDCNSTPFTVDDKVVVEFEEQSWDKPVVIGFAERPQACGVQVKVRFKSAQCATGFVSYCNDRIENLEAFKSALEDCRTIAQDWITWEYAAEGKSYGYLFGAGLRGQ